MRIGPLRRSVGIVGLVALVPVLLMVAQGGISLVDAAARASITVVALLVLGRLVGWGMGALASVVESSTEAVPGGGAGSHEEERVS